MEDALRELAGMRDALDLIVDLLRAIDSKLETVAGTVASIQTDTAVIRLNQE